MRLDHPLILRDNRSFPGRLSRLCTPIWKKQANRFGAVAMARRPHPFPSRTRSLSSSAPMVLRGQTAWESRTPPPHTYMINPLGPLAGPGGFFFSGPPSRMNCFAFGFTVSGRSWSANPLEYLHTLGAAETRSLLLDVRMFSDLQM